MVWLFFLLAYSAGWECGLAIQIGVDDARAIFQSCGSGCCSGSASGSGGLSSTATESASATMTRNKSQSRYSTEIIEECESSGFWRKVSIFEGLSDEKLESVMGNTTLARLLVDEVIMLWSGEEHGRRNTSTDGNCSAFKVCTRTVSNGSQILTRTKDLLRSVKRCERNISRKLKFLIADPAACKSASCLNSSKQLTHSGDTCGVKLQNFSCAHTLDNCTWSNCLDSIQKVESLLMITSTVGGYLPGLDSETVFLLRRLNARITAEYTCVLRLERGLSTALERCSAFLLKNCFERLHSARFDISAERTVLAAAAVTFKTILSLHTLGGLVSWGERAGASVNSRKKNSKHTDEILRRGSLKTAEHFRVLCEQFHPCNEAGGRGNCSFSADVVCLNAKRSVLDSRDFSTNKTSATLMSTVELLCKKNVSVDGKLTTWMSNLSGNSCPSYIYCPPLRKCPFPQFIESSHVDLMSISPEEVYRAYVFDVFRYSGLAAHNVTSLKNCRLRCRLESPG